MKKLDPLIVNEMRQTVLFDKNDIEMLIVERARELCNMPNANYKIHIEEQLEGSPPYKVGYKARVELVLPMLDKQR